MAMIVRVFKRSMLSLLFLSGATVLIFFLSPTLLIASSETPKTDVILDFSIDWRSKSGEYIAWLYREKVAPKIITLSSQVAEGAFPSDNARDHLISLGVKPEDVYSYHLPIVGCRAEAFTEIAKYLNSQGLRRILIISRPESSRYIGVVGRRVFGREGLETWVGYAPEDYIELTSKSWASHWKVQRLVDESMNIALDQFYAECR
jgi:hypothetical protein